jgi:hypothetical protein
MTYTYGLHLDEPYFRTMVDRYYRQRPVLLRPKCQFALVGLLMLVVCLWMAPDGRRVGFTLAMLVLYCVAAAIGLVIIRTFVFQSYRYSRSFGSTSLCTISDRGLQFAGTDFQHAIDWAAFRSAVRFRDGMMLLRFVPDPAFGGSKNSACWLPDTALKQSNPSEVDRFVRTKIRVRNVA